MLSFYQEIIQSENWYYYCYFTASPIYDKTQVFKLSAKMLLVNQIAGFFKI